MPQITWYLNGSSLISNGSVVEIIEARKSQHEGLYRCEAKNPAGIVTASAFVAVKGQNSGIIFFSMKSKNTAISASCSKYDLANPGLARILISVFFNFSVRFPVYIVCPPVWMSTRSQTPHCISNKTFLYKKLNCFIRSFLSSISHKVIVSSIATS